MICGVHIKAPPPEATRRGQIFLLEIYLFLDVVLKLRYGHTNLSHGIPVAYSNGPVLKGIEVNGYAQRGTYLVLSAIALAYGAAVIEIHHEALGQKLVYLPCLIAQLVFLQRQYGRLVRSQSGVKMQHVAHIAVPRREKALRNKE